MPAPKKEKRFIPMSFRFSNEELALIERLAKKQKITKTQVLREGLKALELSQ